MTHARARGWVEHLSGGGTTPWSAWDVESTSPGGVVPGAQQLELLRRLNLAGQPSAGLVDRTLGASAPGRGSPDLELIGAAAESAFGPRPVDPSGLAAEELIRVAAGLVAEDLVASGTPVDAPARLLGMKRRLAPSYRLVGDAWAAPLIRADLARQGWIPGGRNARVLVLAADFETLVVDAWIARCFGEGAPPWRAWLDPFVRENRPPPRADLVRIAGRHRAPEFVYDVELLPGLLRNRGLRAPRVRLTPRPSAAAAEAARRVGGTLDLLVLPERRAELLTTALLPRLIARPGEPLRLPPRATAWAEDQSRAQERTVRAAGHRLHGDPTRVAPTGGGPVPAPRDEAVLDLLLGLLLHPDPPDGKVSL